MSLEYQLRVHPRARHVRLRVDPHHGLIITVPKAFDQRRLPALLEARRDWIESVQARIGRLRAAEGEPGDGLRPARIELAALNRGWTVDYRVGRRTAWDEQGDALRVSLPEEAPDGAAACALRNWLSARARSWLPGQVRALADEHGFRHGRVSIRQQRSRWGSCSAAGHLSLNARLLLVSPAACRYVLIHELVHTEHLDHSPRFWRRVAELAPDYRASIAELKRAWQRLPAWVVAG